VKMTLAQIAELVGGSVKGDAGYVIEGAAGLSEAGPADISFLGNAKYTALLKETRAGAVLVPPSVSTDGRNAVVLKNPPYGWAKVLEVLEAERRRRPAPGVHATAVVAKSARLGKDVSIGPYVVIEDEASVGDNTVIYAHGYVGRGTSLGKDCLLHPRVTVREGVRVGDRCVFQPGVVIGCDGFGFTPSQGRHYKIPQVGGVVIEDDVEVQANSTIDRAAVGDTKIGRGTKIDNLVQVAHNVETGENCLIVALTGVAGSVKIGNNVTLAAQVGVTGHITIGDGVMVGAKGGVAHSLKAGDVVWGTPAQPLKDELKVIAATRRLPEVLEELKKLKKKFGL
jgi:UDP-3-O-[3-hydroxymyristoyl] glucosamine N-acyltransferase